MRQGTEICLQERAELSKFEISHNVNALQISGVFGRWLFTCIASAMFKLISLVA